MKKFRGRNCSHSYLQKRQFFIKRDEDLIHQYLDSCIQSGRKIICTEFIKLLEKIPEMPGEVRKFGVTSLLTKIRTERKKVELFMESNLFTFSFF